jgi:hypothetical protein
MSLPTARKDSNAPDGSGDNAASTGELGMVGFTAVPYSKFGPATSNNDIPSTGSNGDWSMGQDGTSVGAYKFQAKEFPGEDPDLSPQVKGQGK